MIQVTINGKEQFSGNVPARTLPDLLELVKTTIDPDHVIMAVSYNGHVPTDDDWRAPLASQQELRIEVISGTMNEYVAEKLQTAEACFQFVIDKFALARENFEAGLHREGTKVFAAAIKDLQASLEWVTSVLAVPTPKTTSVKDEFNRHVGEISLTCEQLLQQQLYQSWWAISETIEGQLNPGLAKLRDLCAVSAQN